jgi:hypothetical protein
MLSEFLSTHRETIITNSRAKVASRTSPRVSALELEAGVPLFLDQLVATLRVEETTSGTPSDEQIGLSAAKHGKALHECGFTAAQVIHDYGDVCQGITDLAVALKAPITTEEFRTLNRCLDEAMAEAVSEFGRLNERAVSDDKSEASMLQGLFSRELQDLVGSSMLAFEILQAGMVGIGGSTAGVLGHNLVRMRDLIDRSLTGESAVAPPR